MVDSNRIKAYLLQQTDYDDGVPLTIDNSQYQRLQRVEAEYLRLLAAIEALRQIPAWATILLATDEPPPPYIVFIRNGDVGGDLVLSTGADSLIAALESAIAQYRVYDRDIHAPVSDDQTLTPEDIARGQQLAREWGMDTDSDDKA